MSLRKLTVTTADFVSLFQGGTEEVRRVFTLCHDPYVTRSLAPHATKIAERLEGPVECVEDSADWSTGRLKVSMHQAEKCLASAGDADSEIDPTLLGLAEYVVSANRPWVDTVPSRAVVVSQNLPELLSLDAGEEVEGALSSFPTPRYQAPEPLRSDDVDDEPATMGGLFDDQDDDDDEDDDD